jgi:hypothetical protein
VASEAVRGAGRGPRPAATHLPPPDPLDDPAPPGAPSPDPDDDEDSPVPPGSEEPPVGLPGREAPAPPMKARRASGR